MKVVNLKFTEIHDIKTGVDIQIANTVRFTDDERESLKNTLKEIKQYNDSLIKQYNDSLIYPKVLVSYASFCIRFKAWYRFYKVEENGKITWKVREDTEDTSKFVYPICNDLIIPEYNFDSFFEMLDWLRNTFEK